MSTIPVICDRCRSTGNSGEGDFAHLGDLLDFAPVPRRKRVNGWDAEAQRAFIAALAMTGSKTTAAKSLGRNAFGIDQLLKSEGSEGFRLAFDRAIAIAEKNGAMRIATGVADAAARNAWLDRRSALRGAEPDPERPVMSDDHKLEIIHSICRKYFGKTRQEREERLAGDVVAADLYLRQMTFIEVGLDLAATDLGITAFDMLSSLQRDGHGWMRIAETPFSRALDAERRRQWGLIDEPERPEPTVEGEEHVRQEIAKSDWLSFDLRHVDLVGPGDCAFPISDSFWANNEEQAKAKALCEDLGAHIYPNNPLGFGNQGLLLAFPVNCPNNSLPILHSPARADATREWLPLFPRAVH